MSPSIPPHFPLSSPLDSPHSIERNSCRGKSSSVSAPLSGQKEIDAVICSDNSTIPLFSGPEIHASYDKSPSTSPTHVNALERGHLSDRAATHSLFLQPLASTSSTFGERESGMSVSIPLLSPFPPSLNTSPYIERARRDICRARRDSRRGSGSSACTLLSKRDAVIRSGNSKIPLFSGPEINDQCPSTSPTCLKRGHLEILSESEVMKSVTEGVVVVVFHLKT